VREIHIHGGRPALLGLLFAVALSGAACSKTVLHAPPNPQNFSTRLSFYRDSLTPRRALAIAPVGLVGTIAVENSNPFRAGQPLVYVRVVRTLFNVSEVPIRKDIIVTGLPPATPVGSKHLFALYPIRNNRGWDLYGLVSRYAGDGSIEKVDISYRRSDGEVYIPISSTDTVSCFHVSPGRHCRNVLLETIGIQNAAQRSTYAELLSRDSDGSYWWLRARDRHRLAFPTQLCSSGSRPAPCASTLTFRKISGVSFHAQY
jgi:hypothetical protein